MFQNGIKAVKKVLEVATDGPENTFVLFKAQAEELLAKMLTQL